MYVCQSVEERTLKRNPLGALPCPVYVDVINVNMSACVYRLEAVTQRRRAFWPRAIALAVRACRQLAKLCAPADRVSCARAYAITLEMHSAVRHYTTAAALSWTIICPVFHCQGYGKLSSRHTHSRSDRASPRSQCISVSYTQIYTHMHAYIKCLRL